MACTWKPTNSSYNTATSITQTYNWSQYLPSATATYNITASSSECRFKCDTSYTWNSSDQKCYGTCASYTSWNWTFTIWKPTNLNTAWQTTSPSSPCYVSCNSWSEWDGIRCNADNKMPWCNVNNYKAWGYEFAWCNLWPAARSPTYCPNGYHVPTCQEFVYAFDGMEFEYWSDLYSVFWTSIWLVPNWSNCLWFWITSSSFYLSFHDDGYDICAGCSGPALYTCFKD
jgi:hypothetical protein